MHESDQSDGLLLAEFATSGSHQAFAQIVARHGAMVHAVAKRVVGDHHAAEDVAQAAFLALAQKAASLRQGSSVGAWLHHVAWCLAQDAGKIRRRREDHEAASMHTLEPSAPAEVDRQAFQAELDAAINQLAERYRQPLVLFHLEGLSLQQTAERLGLNLRTVGIQLARARELLRKTLVRRGVTLSSVGVLLTLLSAESGAATLPATFVSATVKAAALAATGKLAAGVVTGAVSANVAVMTKGALKMMFWNKVKTAAAAVTATVVVAGGGVLVAQEVAQPKATVVQVNGAGVTTRVVPADEKAPQGTAEKRLDVQARTAAEAMAEQARCMYNVKQLCLAFFLYAEQEGHDGRLPESLDQLATLLKKSQEILHCPADKPVAEPKGGAETVPLPASVKTPPSYELLQPGVRLADIINAGNANERIVIREINARHDGKRVAGYADGHVSMIK